MKKFRIYISKSKQSDFNELLKLKSDLSKFKNIEVLEFQGGNYTPDLLLNADLMILIPPKDSIFKSSFDYFYLVVGKGQFEEFSNYNMPCFLYHSEKFYEIEDYSDDLEEQTWQKWGDLIISNDTIYENLKDFLNNYVIGLTEFEKSIEILPNQLKKLLINHGN